MSVISGLPSSLPVLRAVDFEVDFFADCTARYFSLSWSRDHFVYVATNMGDNFAIGVIINLCMVCSTVGFLSNSRASYDCIV